MGSTLSWAADEERDRSYERFYEENKFLIDFTNKNKESYLKMINKCFSDISTASMSISYIEFISSQIKKDFSHSRYHHYKVNFITPENFSRVERILENSHDK